MYYTSNHAVHWKRYLFMACSLLFVACAFLGQRAHSAGLLIADGGFGGTLEIKEHTVDVSINNGIAVTNVTQIFVNTENRIVEALYTFPIPEGASVSNFSMWINGKEMMGEVVEKERAREIYNSYKRRNKDPGLLEQVDFKRFEMRIFPIPALAEQKVQITYYQELGVDHDWVTYTYPLATNTKGATDERVQGKFALSLHVKSEVPIVDIESPSHANDFVSVKHSDEFFEYSMEMPDGSLGRDIVLAYHTVRPHTGLDIITSSTGQEDGYFYLTLTPGEELAGVNAPMDFLFILDISGSMNKDGKLRLSRKSIESFIDTLSPENKFEVMAFNAGPSVLFNELTPMNDESRKRAFNFIDKQRAKGGTDLKSALQAAYGYANPTGDRLLNLVILSDGLTEEDEQATLIQTSGDRPENTRIFCVGIGNEVNRPVLEQMATEAGGLAAFISQEDNFDRQAKAFQRKLMNPVATDIVISLNGIGAYEVVPAILPSLYHGQPLRVYGRYKTPGMSSVTISGVVEKTPFSQAVDFDFPKRNEDNPEIERMWAWHTIQEILASSRSEGNQSPSEGAIAEIVTLGEGYSIVSPYTSFLVLENEGEYKRWSIERRNALRTTRDRTAQQKFREELDRMRTQSSSNMGPQAQDKLANNLDETGIELAPQEEVITPESEPRKLRDIYIPIVSNRGGGAFDPISLGLCLGLGASVLVVRRKEND